MSPPTSPELAVGSRRSSRVESSRSSGTARKSRAEDRATRTRPAAPFLSPTGTDGSASLADPIIDQRTGQRCDYQVLYRKAGALSQSRGLSPNAAFVAVAKAANGDHAESIVRTLHRYRKRSETQLPSDPLVPAGIAVLLERLQKRVAVLEKEVEVAMGSEQEYEDLAERAELILDLVERWIAQLEGSAETAIAATRQLLRTLPSKDPAFNPVALAYFERQRLDGLLKRTKHLQVAIDTSRPKQVFRDRL